jgi:nicotinate-nucleotide adenylyltransferase
MIEITESMLDGLRETILKKMSIKRFRHTVAVEDMVARLCRLYCPEQTAKLRAAALLHDITKELKAEEQKTLCAAYGLAVTELDLLTPKTFHARTAAAQIAVEYPEFADPTVLEAVRWHTTGRANMTLTERLLYLADYIDESRSFPDCVKLREYFWSAELDKMSESEKAAHLRDTLILSYDMTIRGLLDENSPVAKDTFDARNELVCERLKANTMKG